MQREMGVEAVMYIGEKRFNYFENDLDGSLVSLEGARRELVDTDAQQTKLGIEVLAELGAVKLRLKDLPGALASLEEAREILVITDTLGTRAGAMVLSLLGFLAFEQDDLPQSLDLLEKANQILELTSNGRSEQSLANYSMIKRILEATNTLETERGAKVMLDLGVIQFLQGHTEASLSSLYGAYRIRMATDTVMTEDGADVLFRIGAVKAEQMDLQGAFVFSVGAQLILSSLQMLHTEAHVRLLMMLGYLSYKQNELPEALTYFASAREILWAMNKRETVTSAQLMFMMAAVKFHQADLPEALAFLREAQQIRMITDTLKTVEGEAVLQFIGVIMLKDIDLRGCVSCAVEQLDSIIAERRSVAARTLFNIACSAPELVAPYTKDIVDRLSDEHWEVRLIIPDLLSRMHDQTLPYMATIENLASDPRPGVHSAVVQTLELLDDIPEAKAALDRVVDLAAHSSEANAPMEVSVPDANEGTSPWNASVSSALLGRCLVPDRLKIRTITRYQKSLDQALMEGPELGPCQEALAEAGISPKLECGAHFFGRPDHYEPMMQALVSEKLNLKLRHIIVTMDLEETVKSVIRSLRSSDQVRVQAEQGLTSIPMYCDRVPIIEKSTFLNIEIPSSLRSAPMAPTVASCPAHL